MKTFTKLSLIVLVLLISTQGNTQNITTIAGNGTAGYTGDGSVATSAELNFPSWIAFDASGNIYFSDAYNNRVRKINTSGIISTIAGNGTAGYTGDGGDATSAELNGPQGLALDGSGNLYIVDYGNSVVRKVNTSGTISTIAGNGSPGYSGDGSSATSAQLYFPQGIALDASGNIYIADVANYVIRKVNTSGIISTVAGNGSIGYSGDGGSATSAQLSGKPTGVYVDASGNLFIADQWNNVIRKVNTGGIISTIAGNGTAGFTGDGGSATSAELNNPHAVFGDSLGNLYITDSYRIREVNTSGNINTIAGNGTAGFSGDGGPATSAEINPGNSSALEHYGRLYIADGLNERIRMTGSIYSPCIPNITNGLVAEYNFNGNANDASGNGNNGTVYNATLTTDRFGNANSAYHFNGTTSYIDVPNTAVLSFSASNAMSISFWVVMDTNYLNGYGQVLVSKQSGSGNTQTGYDIEQSQVVNYVDNLRVGTSGGTYAGGNTFVSPSLHQWHHIVFTYNGNTGISTGYLDGVLENSTGGSTAVIGSSTDDLLFGYSNWSNINALYFYGDLDDIRMYNVALNACDVDSLYNIPNPVLASINSLSKPKENITIYPNPASDILTIDAPDQRMQKIIITDMLGRQVYDKSYTKQIDISALSSGIYIVSEIDSNGNIYRQKIIKQ